MPYGKNKSTQLLIIECENGFGVDITTMIEGEQVQKTYIANTLAEVLDYVRDAFNEG